MTSRRSFLTLLGTLPVGACLTPNRANARGAQDTSVPARTSDLMDEALEMLTPYAPSFRGGLSNHGPMTAEALISLGRQDAVVGWVERYRKRLEARPAPHTPIDAAKWQEALSDHKRNGDWDVFFANELAEAPWRDVVGRWLPRLAPGIAAAGLHCVIRAGHAVCSLELKESAPRLDELARALAYWATEFLRLPGERNGAGNLSPSDALKQVPLLPRNLRRSRGLITTELKDLVGYEPFTHAIDLVDPATGAPNFMAELVASYAGTFVNTRSSSFEFLHAVTGGAAITELLPYVKPDDRADVLAYTWQVTASIYSRYAQSGLVADCKLKSADQSAARLAKLAVASGDEHTIKLAAACTREWMRNPDPRLLAAGLKRAR